MPEDGIDLTDLSSYAGYRAGRSAAIACGCALDENSLSIVARVQFDKMSQAVKLDPTKWIQAWMVGFQDFQLPTIIVIELICREEHEHGQFD